MIYISTNLIDIENVYLKDVKIDILKYRIYYYTLNIYWFKLTFLFPKDIFKGQLTFQRRQVYKSVDNCIIVEPMSIFY